MLILTYAPGTIALASLITLCETGLEFEPRRVNFVENEQRSADYLALNPKGRVPALITAQGVLTETPAILTYLAAIAPDANLTIKGDSFGEAQLNSFMSWLCSTVHVNHAMGRRAGRWTDDPAAHVSLKAKVPETMAACCELLESEFIHGPWVMGEQYTIADPYLNAICTWLEGDGVKIADYPKLAAHFAAMKARPAVQKALAIVRG